MAEIKERASLALIPLSARAIIPGTTPQVETVIRLGLKENPALLWPAYQQQLQKSLPEDGHANTARNR